MVMVGSACLVVFPVPISYVVEAWRAPPPSPTQLGWAPDIPIRYANVHGINIRDVKVGQGPPLVLLHTLRTQLDMFQKLIPALFQDFEVYALDYPGHGFSDIPKVEYTPELFITAVAGFLERVNVEHAFVVGESIGGTIALGKV